MNTKSTPPYQKNAQCTFKGFNVFYLIFHENTNTK